jgi:Fe-S cluster assembly protein SufD
MNMHSDINLNETEQQLLATAGQLHAADSDTPTAAARATAIDLLRSVGLPTRRRERWHYTDLRSLLTGAGSATVAPAKPAASGTDRLEIVDGRITPPAILPDGISISTKSTSGAPIIHPLDDTVKLVNTLLVADDISIDISGSIAETLNWIVGSTAGTHAHSRISIGSNPDAKATVFVDRQIAANSFASLVLNLDLAARSDLTLVIQAKDAHDAKTLVNISGAVAEDAKLTVLVLNVGDGFSRTELEFQVVGDRAHIGLYGANCLSGTQVSDTTLVIDHQSLDSTSEELFKYVGKGRSKGVFQGRINVHPDAQKTDAQMMANALLLSDDAEFLAKPELEIFADDVQCAHGCTAGEMDEEQLFYLMSRGISRPEAEKLLVLSFIAGVFDKLDDDELTESLLASVVSWLDRGGQNG